MAISYRYTQAGEAYEGEIERTEDMPSVHEVVRAVVQKIADETGETVWFSMIDHTGTAIVGIDHAEPQGVDNTGLRTIETVDISEDDGESWNSIHVRT